MVDSVKDDARYIIGLSVTCITSPTILGQLLQFLKISAAIFSISRFLSGNWIRSPVLIYLRGLIDKSCAGLVIDLPNICHLKSTAITAKRN